MKVGGFGGGMGRNGLDENWAVWGRTGFYRVVVGTVVGEILGFWLEICFSQPNREGGWRSEVGRWRGMN